jgi:hypothetical protein
MVVACVRQSEMSFVLISKIEINSKAAKKHQFSTSIAEFGPEIDPGFDPDQSCEQNGHVTGCYQLSTFNFQRCQIE